jgi:hypothetical protein
MQSNTTALPTSSATPPVAAKSASITGKITDAKTGEPAKDVTINIEGKSAATDANGEYDLTVEVGKHSLSVSKEGYETVTRSIIVPETGTMLDISIKSTSGDSTWLWIVLILIIVVVAAGIIYFLYRKKKLKEKEDKERKAKEKKSLCMFCHAPLIAGSKFCNECGKKQEEKTRFCMNCGASMPHAPDLCSKCNKMPPSDVDTKTCKNCSEVIPAVAKFCGNCGARQPEWIDHGQRISSSSNFVEAVLSGIADLIEKITGIESTIESLLEAALDIQKILFDLIVLRIDIVLPPEAEKPETVTKKDGFFPSHNITNYTINIGPFNFSPLEEMLGDIFSDFESQTSSIAEIYAPRALSDEPMTSMFPMQMPEITDLNFARSSGFEASGDKVAALEIYSPLIQNKLYKELKSSAPIINELTTVCHRIAENSIEGEDIQINENMASALPGILPIIPEEKALRPEVHDNLNDFSEMVGNISTSILTKISEVHTKIADIESLNSLSTNATQFTGFIESKEHSEMHSTHKTVEISDHFREISDIAQNISTSIRTKISEVQKVTDIPSLNSLSMNASKTRGAFKIDNIQALNNISPETPISSGSIKNEIQTIQYPDQKNIEIPAFAPRQEFMTPTQEAAINSKNLSYVIGSNPGKGSISGNYPSAQILTTQSTTAPTNMFEALSNYMTIASHIDNQMSAMAEDNIPADVSSPLNLFMEENNLGSTPHLAMFASGKNGGFINEGMATNIAVSMAATDSLNNIGSSAIKSISAAIPPS